MHAPTTPADAAMQSGSTVPDAICWIALAVGVACAAAFAYHIAIRGFRQPAGMDAVRRIIEAYWGPLAAWAYFGRAGRGSLRWIREHGDAGGGESEDEDGRAQRLARDHGRRAVDPELPARPVRHLAPSRRALRVAARHRRAVVPVPDETVMVVGDFTSRPVNAWLLRGGWKETP